MIETLRVISDEKYRIDEKLKQKDERLEFYREFFKKNNCVTLTDAINANPADLAIAIIINKAPHLSVAEVKRIVYGNKRIFGELNTDVVDDLLIILEQFEEQYELYKKAKKILLNNEINNLGNLFKKEGQLAIEVENTINKLNIYPKDFFDFIEIYMKEHKSYGVALAVVATLKDIKEDKEEAYQAFADIAANEHIKIKQKEQNKWINEKINSDFKISELLKPLIAVREEYSKMDREDKVKHRELIRNKTAYETLENDLYKAIQAGEVTHIKTLLKKVPSEKIRLDVLKLVYKHNKEIYDKMIAEYNVLAANDASHYRVLLAKYGISPETYDVTTVMGNSIDDLEKMLSLLSKLNYNNSKELLVIIQNSDLETITNIQGLTEKGIITANLLKQHPAIFSSDTKEYEYFMRNLKLLQDKKINPHYLSVTEDLFVLPTEKLEYSFDTLDQYGLSGQIKHGMNLNFLKDENLPSTIDTLLELGYESNLLESIELLNYKDKFDRLKVLKLLNIPADTTEELKEILTTEKFYVSDEEVQKYIYNATDAHLPKNVVLLDTPKKKVADNPKLTTYSNTPLTYSFDGVLISKNKVRRNSATLDTIGKQQDRLLYSVLKGSTLTDDEIAKIEICLSPLKTTNIQKKKQ